MDKVGISSKGPYLSLCIEGHTGQCLFLQFWVLATQLNTFFYFEKDIGTLMSKIVPLLMQLIIFIQVFSKNKVFVIQLSVYDLLLAHSLQPFSMLSHSIPLSLLPLCEVNKMSCGLKSANVFHVLFSEAISDAWAKKNRKGCFPLQLQMC